MTPSNIKGGDGLIQQRLKGMRTRACATKNRRTLRRLAAESQLADVLPTLPAPGTAYHVISHGDIDLLNYASFFIKTFPFDYLSISSWVSSMADIDLLINWVEKGVVKRLDLFLGEFADNRDPDLSDKCWRAERDGYNVRLILARNHSKVLLCSNEAEDIYIAMESSANLNRNSRIEQTVITRDRDLFEFYREFYSGIIPIRRNPYLKARK